MKPGRKPGTTVTPWTDAELARLTEVYPRMQMKVLRPPFPGRTRASLNLRAQKAGIGKAPDYDHPSRIKPGETPWNKGKHYQPGGRCAETQFKPGHDSGRTDPIGIERDYAGYLYRKTDDKPCIANQRASKDGNWTLVHHLIYEQAHGTIPKGCIVVFRDGNRRNFALPNLECITRAERMRRNSRHTRYGKDLNRVIAQRIALVRKLNQLKQDNQS